MLTDQQIFQRAFSFVSDPSRLLQDGRMRDWAFRLENRGEDVQPMRACSVGWLTHCGGAYDGLMRWQLNLEAARRGCKDGILGYNDTHTHAEVVDLWRAVGERMGWL
jgi:hypothetical protein